MNQTSHLIKTLKRCLRAKGQTYRDVASALKLSESSVKRLFAEETFSVSRLEDICRFLGMSIYDLSRLAASRDDHPTRQLSVEQETALAADPLLISFFYLLLIGWAPSRIGRRLKLDKPTRIRYLANLERLKLIEVMPGMRVRLLTDSRIDWRVAGPVRSRFEAQVKREFIDHRFHANDEAFMLESNELSDASIVVLLRRLDRLAEEFSELADLDRHLPKDKKRSFGLLIGARPWTFWNIVSELSRMDRPAR